MARALNNHFDKQYQNITFGKEGKGNRKVLSPLKGEAKHEEQGTGFRVLGEI